jgi:hypothetical protein
MAAAAATRPPVITPRVHRPERWCGQGREDLRVLSHALGDAFAAAGQSGVDELVHVSGVLVGAAWAALLTTVATPHQQRPVGLLRGRVDDLVAAPDDALQPDRMPTRPGPADLIQPALPLGVTGPGDQAVHGRRVL